tara:strand:- start:1087 stop:1602 length:516 start_codon:yes stop_codon:yes gene_type:complete
MIEHFTNENYLDSKNHKLQSSNKFELEQNIITSDPNVIPNGFIEENKNEVINNDEVNNTNQLLQDIPLDVNNFPSISDNLNTPEISPSVSDNFPKEENTPLTNYLNEVVGANKNKQDRKTINELKKLSKMNKNERNNMIIGNELMEVFPISLIIAFIIFILLLIYVIGFKG